MSSQEHEVWFCDQCTTSSCYVRGTDTWRFRNWIELKLHSGESHRELHFCSSTCVARYFNAIVCEKLGVAHELWRILEAVEGRDAVHAAAQGEA